MNCPSPELLAAMAEGKLQREERESLLPHLADCDDCRQAALALASDQRATTRRRVTAAPRAPSFPWAVAAAILVLALAGWAIWRQMPRAEHKDVVKTPPPRETTPPAPEPEPAPEPPPVPKPEPAPDLPKPAPKPDVPAPEPSPEPKPPAPGPGETKPEPPKPPPPKPEPAPARELAAVRLLDVTGQLTLDKKAVAEGQMVAARVASSTGAAFRVEGDLVMLSKGAVATVARSRGVRLLDVESGEALVESDGGSWLLEDGELTLKGRAIVSSAGVVLLSDLTAAEAAKRAAPYRALVPRQRTWYFDDCADRAGGVMTGSEQGPMLGMGLGLPAGTGFKRTMSVRFRYRTNCSGILQACLGMQGEKRYRIVEIAPKKGWQEIVLPVTRFSDPEEPAEPKTGTLLVGLSWNVESRTSGREKAFLEIDDVAVIERDP